MSKLIKEMNAFLGRAMLATYAGGGAETRPKELPGFRELEYKEGDWYYKDSYTGYFQSWGRETVWLKGKPFWTQLYGGGIVPEKQKDKKLVAQAFVFLKECMSTGEKSKGFQPRGPKSYKSGDWSYTSTWKGTIKHYTGEEKIKLKGKVVFTHRFIGGLVLAR